MQLHSELTFVWTALWKKLQFIVVNAGVSVKENPIPAIAAAAISADLSPYDIDREWAWQQEASLRPDLQITWSTNVDRFDALRKLPEIMTSGLLPSKPVGPMPRRGFRARHGKYPLPRSLEELLETVDGTEGLSRKQLNETAHFIWKSAREIGLYSRGDEPAAVEVFNAVTLAEIFNRTPHRLGKKELAEHERRAAALEVNAGNNQNINAVLDQVCFQELEGWADRRHSQECLNRRIECRTLHAQKEASIPVGDLPRSQESIFETYRPQGSKCW